MNTNKNETQRFALVLVLLVHLGSKKQPEQITALAVFRVWLIIIFQDPGM